MSGRCGRLRGGSKGEIVWAVGNQFVAKRFEDLAISQEEGAGHLLHIACGQSNEVAIEPGKQHTVNAFAVEVLAQFGVSQAEGLIQLAGRIGETRQIVQFVRSEEFCGALFGSQMHEGQTGPFGFQFAAKLGELGDRLATKGSAKVAQENEQKRMVDRQRVDGFTGIRTVGLQEFESDVFGSEHDSFEPFLLISGG